MYIYIYYSQTFCSRDILDYKKQVLNCFKHLRAYILKYFGTNVPK